MQTVTRNGFVVLGAALILTFPAAYGLGAPAAPAAEGAYGQQPGWDVPPQEYNEVQRRGYHDGVEGARKDYGNGRRPNVNNRDEYRDPDDLPREIPPELRGAYRDAFRRGYAVAAHNLWGAPPPPPMAQPPQQEWEWGMRGLLDDAGRQGYHDGVRLARADFQRGAEPDPMDAQRYRVPPVPAGGGLQASYRNGFMRGYTICTSQLRGDPQWEYSGEFSTWQPPARYNQFERRGFHEGVEAARKDFGNHRQPNPANRDEYRNPPVPPGNWEGYRRGFRHGYEMAALRLWGA